MNYSIFEYKMFASCNFLSVDSNNFDIKIQEDGTIKYEEFDLNNNILQCDFYSLSPKVIEKIKKVINKNSEIKIARYAPKVSLITRAETCIVINIE